ncbi:hypothetical protein GCM10010912_61380 [Paenibacillus albidus]|uniref:Uncharacterized protein n=1 Tax=Paenibacillus albidus TaxID=2041023 RepID=A0A917FWJ0_9BACL|nr:hypothetical protein GCM10010912_61380 [Paenibacillus albidus]
MTGANRWINKRLNHLALSVKPGTWKYRFPAFCSNSYIILDHSLMTPYCGRAAVHANVTLAREKDLRIPKKRLQ